MFNWIKKVFHGDDLPKDSNGLPLVTCDIPMPKVKPPKLDKDISEPVLAIVECMKKYPSRFKLDNFEARSELHSWSEEWTISDVKTGQVINVIYNYNAYREDALTSSWKWLTKDELDLLKMTFEDMGKIKTQRMYSIQRAKIKGFYKNV